MKIEFLSFSSSAITPTQGTKDLACFDLYSVENVIVPANSMKIIKTGIGFKIPRGYFGKIYARHKIWQLDVLNLVVVSLTPTIEVQFL